MNKFCVASSLCLAESSSFSFILPTFFLVFSPLLSPQSAHPCHFCHSLHCSQSHAYFRRLSQSITLFYRDLFIIVFILFCRCPSFHHLHCNFLGKAAVKMKTFAISIIPLLIIFSSAHTYVLSAST